MAENAPYANPIIERPVSVPFNNVDCGGPCLLGMVVRTLGRLESALVIVKPETVISWHRKGFPVVLDLEGSVRKNRKAPVSQEVGDLIRTMSRANPLWGAPRIHRELLKLGIDIGETSPSQSWRAFLDNHFSQLVSVDFFTETTIHFQVLYVFLVLAHERRRILHFNVTAHPTAE